MKEFNLFSGKCRKVALFFGFFLFCLLNGISVEAANVHTITKTAGTLITIPAYSPGDMFIIQGDSLEDVPNNDWDELKYLMDDFYLVLKTPNQALPADAFNNCGALLSVEATAPTFIGLYAFVNCFQLQSAIFPAVVSITNQTFDNCNQLQTVSFPNMVTVGQQAFSSCTSLRSIDLPSVVTIESSAFVGCTALEMISFANLVTLGNAAFDGCTTLKSISLPLVTMIEINTFSNCTALESINLPNVTTIGYGAFSNCTDLQTVFLPNVTTIETSGFSNCTALETAKLPNVVALKDFAFSNCLALEVVSIPQVASIGSFVFATTALLCVELGSTPPVTTGGLSVFTPILLIVPDSTVYTPLVLMDYPPGTEAFHKTDPTEPLLLLPGISLTLTPNRIPTLPGGVFQWKKDGYPIAGANSSSYQPSDEGLYTLEYTYGGRIVLLSKRVTKDLYSFYGNLSRYEGCLNTLVFTFAPSGIARTVHVHSEGSGAGYVIDTDSGKYFKNSIIYQLPAQDSILVIRYQIDPEVENGSRVRFVYQVSGGVPESTETFDLYALPVITLQKYSPPAPNYQGRLEISIENGSPYIQRSLNEGVSWEFVCDTATGKLIPFTQSQIANLEDSTLILFRQPNSCLAYDTLLIVDPVNPFIQRRVIMPEIRDALCSILPGEHFVFSGRDFSFTITPVAGNTGRNLQITTSRILLPDSEGVSIVKHNDGSYTVTLFRIQEPTVVYVDFVMANDLIETDKVWSYGGSLFMQTEKGGEAYIYGITGSFVRVADFRGGEMINIPLHKGFYMVAIHGKTFKVVVQ